jgi:hypothetical protein
LLLFISWQVGEGYFRVFSTKLDIYVFITRTFISCTLHNFNLFQLSYEVLTVAFVHACFHFDLSNYTLLSNITTDILYICVVTIPSFFPLSRFIIGFETRRVTSRAGTTYPSGKPEFIPVVFIVVRVAQSLVLRIVFCRPLFVFL